jgi:hypothetical protein
MTAVREDHMSGKKLVVRTLFGALIAVAGAVHAAAAASADAPSQVAPARCTWGGDGLLAEKECDNEGDTGSASGSGKSLGQLLGRAL